jgi:hypothetical protein
MSPVAPVNGVAKTAGAVDLLPSVSEAIELAERWEAMPGERRMVASLLRWLVSARWLGSASRAAFEVPWRGRRIDLVTINSKGWVSAFEFKLGGTARAFEQALYNSASTHRSFIVSGGNPTPEYRALAHAQGLGVFVVNGSVRLLERPVFQHPRPDLVNALRNRALAAGARHV